jgi:hypothetical protein
MGDNSPDEQRWQCRGFVVNKSPYALWDPYPQEQSLFVESLNPDYFEQLANLYESELAKDADNLTIATVLRSTYLHGLETFISLLFATFQAPRCPLGWLHTYKRSDLVELTKSISAGDPILSNLPISESSWRGLASALFEAAQVDVTDDSAGAALDLIGKQWRVLGGEFIEIPADEYNGIKHGFRVRAGGFRLMVGNPGVTGPTDSELLTLSDSKYGMNYHSLEKVPDMKAHFTLTRHFANWDPERLTTRLRWIALSLRNFVALLRAANSPVPITATLEWPTSENALGRTWTEKMPAYFNFKHALPKEAVEHVTAETILSGYKYYPYTETTSTTLAPTNPSTLARLTT